IRRRAPGCVIDAPIPFEVSVIAVHGVQAALGRHRGVGRFDHAAIFEPLETHYADRRIFVDRWILRQMEGEKQDWQQQENLHRLLLNHPVSDVLKFGAGDEFELSILSLGKLNHLSVIGTTYKTVQEKSTCMHRIPRRLGVSLTGRTRSWSSRIPYTRSTALCKQIAPLWQQRFSLSHCRPTPHSRTRLRCR